MDDDHHPAWFDRSTPARNEAVLPVILERNAKEVPDSTFCRFTDGEAWTYAETWLTLRRTAALLAGQGVERGDLVLVWLPNSAAILRTWFALNHLGAVFVPLNLDYRGKVLEHVIAESQARLMVAHGDLVSRLSDIDCSCLETVLAVAGNPADVGGGVRVTVTTLEPDTEEVEITDPADVQVWDPQMVIFTSGTTGPSKGVLCPYLQLFTVGKASYGYMTHEDCILVDLPIFHVGGVAPIIAAITNRGSVALYDGFSATEFWSRIQESNATTISGLVGSMAAFLTNAPIEPGEDDNPLRMVTCMLNEQTIEAAKRYRFSYCSGFNMTELSVPLVAEVDCGVAGSCGRPRTGVSCRVVDEHDYECAPGVAGELVVRTDQPWETFLGYLNRPEATAAAWRNGWFHTGDLVRQDDRGDFFFVDRLKDVVRRRGENVSSVEVESEVSNHPSVAEAAVVGVASEFGDEEILVAVVVAPNALLDELELVEYLMPRMAHYMVPRYVRVVEALPKTPTNKVQKFQLRAEGVTADTWDREAAGIRLRRTRLS